MRAIDASIRPFANRWYLVTDEIEAVVNVGTVDSNTYLGFGSSKALSGLWQRTTLRHGDIVASLYGGNFLYRDGLSYPLRMKPPTRHVFERGPEVAERWPLDRLEPMAKPGDHWPAPKVSESVLSMEEAEQMGATPFGRMPEWVLPEPAGS